MKSTKVNIADLRNEYKARKLSEKEVDKSPIKEFDIWFSEALTAQLPEPNAMTLATATRDGIPSARIVLLKGFDEKGFSFYSNYLSKKGKELTKNPWASIVFFWPELERQVRIEGRVEKISKEESTAYFHSRPRENQLGAVASPQSQVIPNRELMEIAMNELEKKYEGKEIPKPAHWGGFILNPISIEFWQGRPGRLHDRLQYQLMEKGKWKIQRLAP